MRFAVAYESCAFTCHPGSYRLELYRCLPFWYATLAIFAVMLPISTIGSARAPDHERPDCTTGMRVCVAEGPCCDGSDAMRVDNADWASGLMFGGMLYWMNRTALSVRWFGLGHPGARCFMPGSMS